MGTLMPKQTKGKTCEICGDVAHWESKISPMGFIKGTRKNGYTEYLAFHYCHPCLNDLGEAFWKKLDYFKIG
ncbi:hypothetical protein CMK18_23445 [Candidatus Poribacteria bacterium]|nr:hypothetical protein [Candidatus Poribacteria bacterium]